MRIVAFNVHPDPQHSEAMGFSYLSFDDVLKQADILTQSQPHRNEHYAMGRSPPPVLTLCLMSR